jgi:Tol biopolymer transport system component
MDLWVYELERETLSRLTFDEEADFVPVWTPDGQRVAFSSNRDGGTWNLYWKRADGTGDAERLTESGDLQLPWSWSPGGKVLAFFERSAETRWDLWTLPMEEDEQGALKPGKPTVFLRTPFIEGRPAFSPDGRWIAYNSNESGRFEVYVRPFPGPGGKWQISTTGGEIPTWSKNRRELFYRTLDNRIMVVTYSVEGDSFRAGRPRLWSEGQFTDRGLGRNFDLHPDGKRFAVLKAAEGTEEVALDHLTLVTNWFDEVRRRVASAGQN